MWGEGTEKALIIYGGNFPIIITILGLSAKCHKDFGISLVKSCANFENISMHLIGGVGCSCLSCSCCDKSKTDSRHEKRHNPGSWNFFNNCGNFLHKSS